MFILSLITQNIQKNTYLTGVILRLQQTTWPIQWDSSGETVVRKKKRKEKSFSTTSDIVYSATLWQDFGLTEVVFSFLLNFVNKKTCRRHWGLITAAVCPSSKLLRPHTLVYTLSSLLHTSSKHKQPENHPHSVTDTGREVETRGQQCVSCEFPSHLPEFSWRVTIAATECELSAQNLSNDNRHLLSLTFPPPNHSNVCAAWSTLHFYF